MPDLNDKQRAFVEAFIRTGNAAEAFRQAGYAGASPKQAAANAARMLASDSIRAAIDSILRGNTITPPPDTITPPDPDEGDAPPKPSSPRPAEVVVKPARSGKRRTVEELLDEMEAVAFGEPDEELTYAAKVAMMDRLAKTHRLYSDGVEVHVAAPGDLDGIDYDRFTDEELAQFERLLAIGRGRRPPDRGDDRPRASLDAPVRNDP